MLGFSAGAHLASVLSSSPEHERNYPKVDDSDSGSVRPDFTLLIYPAYLSLNDAGEQLASEITPSRGMPPAFLVQTEDDHAFVEAPCSTTVP